MDAGYAAPVGLFGKRIKDGVEGEARVVALAPTRKGARQTEKRNVQMMLTLEVSGPSFGPIQIEHVDTVPHEKAPLVGDSLPITVSTADPSQLKIEWEAAPDLAARALASAAAAQRGDTKGAAEALGFTLKEDDHS
jgi:hypothetical protein